MAERNQYLTPIPGAVIEKLPMVLSNHSAAFDIRISAFPGDDDEPGFSIDVYTDAQRIEPRDKRQRAYLEAKRTSYFFTAEGGFDGDPQSSTTRYQN